MDFARARATTEFTESTEKICTRAGFVGRKATAESSPAATDRHSQRSAKASAERRARRTRGTCLLRAERGRRIDARRAPRGDPAGERGDGEQRRDHRGERRGIGGGDAEEERLNRSRQAERRDDADAGAGDRGREPLPENQR